MTLDIVTLVVVLPVMSVLGLEAICVSHVIGATTLTISLALFPMELVLLRVGQTHLRYLYSLEIGE